MVRDIGRVLIVGGVFLLALGLVLTFAPRIPLLGKLPGDIIISRGGFQVFFPIVTCLLLSIILTIVVNLVLGFFK